MGAYTLSSNRGAREAETEDEIFRIIIIYRKQCFRNKIHHPHRHRGLATARIRELDPFLIAYP